MGSGPLDPQNQAPQAIQAQVPTQQRALERDLDALASRAAITGLRFVRNPSRDPDQRLAITRSVAMASGPVIAFLTLVSGQWPGGLIWAAVFPVVFYFVVGRLARRGGSPGPGQDPVDWRPGPAAYRQGATVTGQGSVAQRTRARPPTGRGPSDPAP